MIELQGVTAGYQSRPILNNISVSFEQSRITAIIGKNGCGKSTLLKVASNLMPTFSGDIFFDQVPMKKLSRKDLAKRISVLPQTRDLIQITLEQLVMHGRFPYLGFSRIPQPIDREKVDIAISQMGLDDYRERNLAELSGGERQKAYLAMVLAQDTDYIFLDEPSTFLDIGHQLDLLEHLVKLKNAGKGIIVVMHTIEHALSYADNICLMEEGRIVAFDRPEQLVKSGEIERVFKVSCQLYPSEKNRKYYVIGR